MEKYKPGYNKIHSFNEILKFRETEKERLVRFTDIEEIELVSDDYQ